MKRRYSALAVGGLLLIGQGLFATTGVAGGGPKCFGETATIVTDDGPNTVNGTGGADVIVTNDGNDVVKGKGGNDRICTGKGRDTAEGGEGNDKINGGPGDENTSGGGLHGDDGKDTILGADGEDLIYAQTSKSIKLNPDVSGNVLKGGKGDDELYSDRGGDKSYGGSGNDNQYAGLGKDEVYGNGGDDDLEVQDKQGNDLVNGGPDLKGDTCSNDKSDDRLNCEFSPL